MYLRVKIAYKRGEEERITYRFVGPFQHPISSGLWMDSFLSFDKEGKLPIEQVGPETAHWPVYRPESNPPRELHVLFLEQRAQATALASLEDAS